MTPIDAFCTLQPQYHHLDALADNAKSQSRAEREAENPLPKSEARTINMAVKSTDEEDIDMGDMGRVLKTMREEEWQHLEWIDEKARPLGRRFYRGQR